MLGVTNLAAPGSTNGGPGSFKGGWQYRESMSGFANVHATRGLGTNGLGIFNGNVKSVDNLDYGITSVGDNVATSQSSQLFKMPLVKNSIQFTFSGLPADFIADSEHVSNVRFQYGARLTEPNFQGTPDIRVAPEPASVVIWMLLISCGAIGTVWQRRRRIAR
jgi:hypothetical protein